MGLNALINNNRSAKIRNRRKNKNKFNKDNMSFNYDEQYFIYYNNEKLTRQRTTCRWNDKKEDFDIFIEFWNKEACSKCEFPEDCYNGKHRVVKISGDDLALDMETKFQDYLNILKYVTRFSTVEALNGTLKVFLHVNEFLSAGLEKFQNRINICGGAYN